MTMAWNRSFLFLSLTLLGSSFGSNVVTSLEIGGDEECKDLTDPVQCQEWAWFGECEANPSYMEENCRKACGLCPPSSALTTELAGCSNTFPNCEQWADQGKCHGIWTSSYYKWLANGAYVVQFCPLACNVCDISLDASDITLGLGLPQSAPGMEEDKHLYNHLRAKVEEIRQYVTSLEDENVREACKMSHPNCARMALATDCQDHADHDIIKYGCAAACGTCEDLIYDDGIAKAKAMWEEALQGFKAKHDNNLSIE